MTSRFELPWARVLHQEDGGRPEQQQVLQGFKDDKGFNEAKRRLGRLEHVNVGGTDLAIDAARNYRRLRSIGVTVRGTVEVLIATRCLADGLRLLHSDRDFEPFEKHLGLRVVNCGA